MKSVTDFTKIAVWTAALLVSVAFATTTETVKELWQRAEQGDYLTADQKAELAPYLAEFERRGPDVLDAVGGPDGFGYYFVDNQNGDTATYNWIELRGDAQATWVDFDSPDDAAATVPLSFDFPFYGAEYPELSICTNGFITFTEERTASVNQCLPASALGGPAICPFWDDLHLHHDGNQVNNNTVAWRDFGSYVVVQFDNIAHYGFPTPPADRYTFEVILYPNGSIKMQYQEMSYSEYSGSQTIGLQQNNGGTSLEYTCNAGSPGSNWAVWYYRGGYGSLGGTITSNAQPVAHATVMVEGTDLVTSTDGNGFYYFPSAPVGMFSLTTRCFGYTQSQATVVVTNNQTTTQNLSVTSVPVVNFPWELEPLAIPDRDTVYAELPVYDNYDLSGVAVQINDLVHTYVGDLVMWIESPWGTRVLLTNRNGGSGDNIFNCQLDDLAGTPIADGVAPFSNRYLPEEPLNNFADNPCRGTWKLVIFDAANQDQGQLDEWTLRFTGVEIPEGWVHGQVTDEQETPLANAAVFCAATGEQTSTDENGFYGMWLPVGTWSLEFSAAGYCAQTAAGVQVTNNAEILYDVMLGAPAGIPNPQAVNVQAVGEGTFTSNVVLFSSGVCAWDYSITLNADDWLSVSPLEGTIEPSWSEVITVSCNTVGLAAGVYTGEIIVAHNGLNEQLIIPVILDVATSAETPTELPEEFALRGNYPNPFNGQTEIAFDLPQAGHVNLTVHNLLGQEVATIMNESRPAGFHHLNWTAQASNGAALPTGLYFLRLNAGSQVFVSKMILTR